jgi:hypothetical protein
MCRWVIFVGIACSFLGAASASYLRTVTPHITPDEIRWEIDLALYDRLSEVRLERKSRLVGDVWELVEVISNSLPQLVLCDSDPSGEAVQFYRIRYAFAEGAQWLDGVAPESGEEPGGGSGGETGNAADCAEDNEGTLPEPTMPMSGGTNQIVVVLGDHSQSASDAYRMYIRGDAFEASVYAEPGILSYREIELPSESVYTVSIIHYGQDPDYTAIIRGEGVYISDSNELLGVHDTSSFQFFHGRGLTARLYLPGGYIEASDAHDPRRTSHTKLVMVRGQAEREANLTLHGGGYLPDFPQWRGQGVHSAEGASAQWSGSGNALIIAELGNGVEDKLFVELVDEKRFAGTLDLNSSRFQALQTAVNTVLKTLDKQATLSLHGVFNAEFKRVDYYADGSRYGAYIYLDGSASFSFDDISIASPPLPIGASPATFHLEGAFSGSSIAVSGNTAFDQSKEHAGTIAGQIVGESTASVSAVASMGVLFVGEVSLALEGSTSLSASGELVYEQQQLLACGSIDASDFTVTVIGEVLVLNETLEDLEYTHTFDFKYNKEFRSVIFDLNEGS